MGFSDTFGAIVGGAQSILNLGMSPINMAAGMIGGGGGLMGPSGAPGPAGGGGDPLALMAGSGGLPVPSGQPATSVQPTQGGLINQLLGGTGLPSIFGQGVSPTGIIGGLLSNVITQANTTVFGEQAPTVGIGKPQQFTYVVKIYPNGFMELAKAERGSPTLMSRDVQTAKRVFRTISKQNAKLPRKTVKEGAGAQLTKALKDRVLRDVQNGDDHCHCPPACR